MKISGLILGVTFLFLSLLSSAQVKIIIQPSDSVKSLDYKVFKVNQKKNRLIESKPNVFYDFYPIQYNFSKVYFNKEALIVKKENSFQKDSTIYDSNYRIIKKIIYPKSKNTKDSMSILYQYDIQGNIESVKMKTSNSNLPYELDGTYFSSQYLVDKQYHNYYIQGNDSVQQNKFEALKAELHNYYRLYENQNKLVKEKFLTISIQKYPPKIDSTFHTNTYHYDQENRIIKVFNLNNHSNSSSKNYISTHTEQHHYSTSGLIETIEYFNENKLFRKELIEKNKDGVIIAYTNQWISPSSTTSTYLFDKTGELQAYTMSKRNKVVKNITLEYTYNEKEHWIKCLHLDKKRKAIYLIERIIDYY